MSIPPPTIASSGNTAAAIIARVLPEVSCASRRSNPLRAFADRRSAPLSMPRAVLLAIPQRFSASRVTARPTAMVNSFRIARRWRAPTRSDHEHRPSDGQWQHGRRYAEGNIRFSEAPGGTERGTVMKKFRYLVQINKDQDSDWGASVPDLPGCVATGKTIDSALRRIQGAIELHLRGMKADGVHPPRPRARSVVPGRSARKVDFYASVEVAA